MISSNEMMQEYTTGSTQITIAYTILLLLLLVMILLIMRMMIIMIKHLFIQ